MPKLPGILKSGSRTHKRIIKEFAERSDMVYFGYVSQRDDDHHIVRGLTVSTKHHDDHYCIGTYEGYDVVFVERSDSVPGGKSHSWHILEFDLKREHHWPHMFLASKHGQHGFSELLQTKFPLLNAVDITSAYYNAPTLDKTFHVHVSPAHLNYLPDTLPVDTAEMIGHHFEGIDIELVNDKLYLYSERSRLTSQLLTTMLNNGIWLARSLDQKSAGV